jgi:hypothetical protein
MVPCHKAEHRLYEKYFEENNMKQVIIFIISGLFISLNLSIQAAPISVTYTIKTDTGQTPISKYIYGSNWGHSTDYTVQRTGGNRCTAYNWENNWSNAGSDYLFENDTMFDSSNPPVPGLGITKNIDVFNAQGQESIITLQLAGYVSAPISGQYLNNYPAPSQYFYPVQFAKGAPFCSPPNNPNTSDGVVYMDEFVNFLVWKYGYAGTPTGVKFYCLDNEVDIWHATHKEVHPAHILCQEIRDKSIACATAVKRVDPNCQIMGPVLCTFVGFLNLDNASDWSSVSAGRPWFISYYLDEMKKASDANGRRLLDVLDVHWYPPEDDGNGHGICDNREDPQTFNARMQAPRTLWDTGYVLPDNNTYPNGGSSWVNQSYWAQYLPILPRFKSDIATYFPDTNIAITEYTWGPSTQWATGITTADFLGICGKYGVYMTNYWGEGGYIDTAVKMYRNYDGLHSTFGDTNVPAAMSDKVNSSIYASVFASNANELHLIVINKNQTSDITGTFNINSPQNFLAGRVWKFDNNSSSITSTTPISSITNNSFTYTIPKTSVCHIVLQVTPIDVSITSPLDGDRFTSGDDIVIEANASAVNGFVTKVEFFQGSTKLGEDTEPPYSYTWNDVNVGRYSLFARATDNNGWPTNSTAVNINVVSGDATGFILREWWTGISGTSVSNLTSDINYPDNPNGRALITSLEGPTNWADNYGTRIRGYLYPPADGNYTFWIASDDAGSLRLSTDDDPCHAVQIAYVSNWTDPHQWNKETNQQSSPKPLLAGHKYYIEALQKEGGGGDNIAVAWQGPGIATQQVIDGAYLSPWLYNFKDYAVFAPQWLKTNCSRSNAWCSGADRDRDGNVQIDDLMIFAEWWLNGGE